VVDRDPPPGNPAEERFVIKLERIALPDGLRALAYRDPRGSLIVYVSTSLDARAQRVAVMEAIRATRRTGWRTALPPVGVALVLVVRALMQGATSAVRVRPAAWGAAAGATVLSASAAAVFVTTVPQHHGPGGPGYQPGPPAAGPSSPHHQKPAAPGRSDPAQPVAAPGGSPGAGRAASSGQSGRAATSSGSGGAASPAPSSLPAPVPSAPAPAPSPTQTCIINLLGIKVCTHL
jgi:hypothetical protein